MNLNRDKLIKFAEVMEDLGATARSVAEFEDILLEGHGFISHILGQPPNRHRSEIGLIVQPNRHRWPNRLNQSNHQSVWIPPRMLPPRLTRD